jgi:hypothetical protein
MGTPRHLNKSRVERTPLSAAFDFAFALDFARRGTAHVGTAAPGCPAAQSHRAAALCRRNEPGRHGFNSRRMRSHINPALAARGGAISRSTSRIMYRYTILRDQELACMNHTRVTLRTILASLAAGDRTEQILADFPALKAEDVQAAIAFAAASAGEDLPVPATPNITSPG